MYRIEVKGRMPSLNEWLSGTHWRKKNDDKKMLQEILLLEFKIANLPKHLKSPITFSVSEMTKHTRDADNAVLGAKFCAYALVMGGYLPDDNPKYVPTVILHWEKAKKEEKIVYLISNVEQ